MTYIRPDALIFSAVIPKEGDTSDRNTSDYISPDALIFTGVIHRKVTPVTVTPDIHLHLHLVIWQTLLSKATYNWGVHKAIHLEEAIRQRKWS